MSKNNVIELAGRETGNDPLTELLRTGAERLICQAVEAELQGLLAEHADRRTEDGRAGVVRNGHLPAVSPHLFGGLTIKASRAALPLRSGPYGYTFHPACFNSSRITLRKASSKDLSCALICSRNASFISV